MADGLRYPVRDPIERIYERAAQIAQNKILGISRGSGAVASGRARVDFFPASSATEAGVDGDGNVITIDEFLTEVDYTESTTELTI